MARQLRVEFPGAIYHITVRMVGDWRADRGELFRDDNDRERFVERLGEKGEQYNVRLYLYCLMTNHFHLVLETPEGNLSKFMQSLTTAYTVYYNRRHGRHGHVADGRFKAKLVEGDEYLLKLSRYVHLNPLVVGEIKDRPLKERIVYLRRYKWSSFRGYAGLDRKTRLVDYEPLLAEFAGKRADRQKRYKRYVEMGLAETDEEFMDALKESPRSIGSDGFRTWVDEVYQDLVKDGRRPEDAAFRRTAEPLEIGKVMAIAAEVLGVDTAEFGIRRRNSAMRGVAAHLLCRYAGLTQREAAEVQGIGSGAAVSLQMKKLGELLLKDRRLRGRVKQAEERLKEERCAKRGLSGTSGIKAEHNNLYR